MRKLVVLSNMGGARTPDELKNFLINMFKDKRISPGFWRYIIPYTLPYFRYKKVWKNYKKIGGSNIYKWTEKLIQNMESFSDYPINYSMRYTRPHLKDISKNFDHILIISLYPHFSSTTVQSIIDEVEQLNSSKNIRIVHSYYKDMEFNNIIRKSIRDQISNPQDYHLVFSAHGIPNYISKKGDPYRKQIEEHIEILKKMIPEFRSISLGFQSRLGPIKWERPYLEEVLKQFKNQKVIIYPISFLIDNSETDYELKIEYAQRAKNYGIKEYKVLACLNDDKRLAEYLIKLTKI